MLSKFLNDNKANLYLIFRLVIGLMFFLHGAQKFGLLGGSFAFPGEFLMILAAIIEVVVGVLIFWGVYTETAAALGGIEMLYAFFVVHTFGKGFNINPLSNGGEIALLYLVAFMVLATVGAGKLWSHEKKRR